jgi:hypothetical protein
MATWDIEHAARTMDRFDFIAEFVRRQTATPALRNHVAGYQLVKRGQRWNYRITGSRELAGALMTVDSDAYRIYDVIRRTPLGALTQEAELLRADILEADAARARRHTNTGQTMAEAAELLADLDARYEYPGHIEVERGDYLFVFGDAQGPFGYDVIGRDWTIIDPYQYEPKRPGEIDHIPSHSSPAELEAYVRRVIRRFERSHP